MPKHVYKIERTTDRPNARVCVTPTSPVRGANHISTSRYHVPKELRTTCIAGGQQLAHKYHVIQCTVIIG